MEENFLSKFYNRNKYILPTYITANSKKNDDINDAEIYVQNMDSFIRLIQFLLLSLFIIFFYMWLDGANIFENENYYPKQHALFHNDNIDNYVNNIQNNSVKPFPMGIFIKHKYH